MATGGRAGHPDLGESTRERNARLSSRYRPAVAADGEGGLHGAVVLLTRG
jgi:hypothetical protein